MALIFSCHFGQGSIVTWCYKFIMKAKIVTRVLSHYLRQKLNMMSTCVILELGDINWVINMYAGHYIFPYFDCRSHNVFLPITHNNIIIVKNISLSIHVHNERMGQRTNKCKSNYYQLEFQPYLHSCLSSHFPKECHACGNFGKDIASRHHAQWTGPSGNSRNPTVCKQSHKKIKQIKMRWKLWNEMKWNKVK